jgi:hypothetical protein
MKDLNKPILPYNLQFFSEKPESATEPEPVVTPEPTPGPMTDPISAPEPQLSAEEQLAKLMAENKRLKAATDKATSEAANYKKQYRATLSEKEQLDIEKAERDAKMQTELESLRRESSINKMAKSFIAMGYTEENAVKASEAQLDGDFEEFTRIQQSFLTARDKQKESEWMKNAPTPPAGNKETIEDPFLKGFNSK